MAKFLDALKNIFKIKELRGKILITLAILAIERAGLHIPPPGVDLVALEKIQSELEATGGSLWEWVQVFAGGFGLFALGIMPYITSSIIMQLMTKTSKRLAAIDKEGPSGPHKIN